jgi:hypothetical protein
MNIDFYMKVLAILLFLIPINLAASAQTSNDQLADRLHDFEADWLKANLNGDQRWKDRFVEAKLAVLPADRFAIDKRSSEVSAILDPTLAPTEMKVRITGTVTLITNNHAKDRSFRFLDTFNRKDGKWEIIATGITPTSEPSASVDTTSVEATMTGLENSLAQTVAGNDRSNLNAIIAPEFVGTSSDGKVNNRRAWISRLAGQKFNTVKADEIAVHVVSDTVTVVTGISAKSGTKGNEKAGRERFTHTWINRNGHWQLAAAQDTAIP